MLLSLCRKRKIPFTLKENSRFFEFVFIRAELSLIRPYNWRNHLYSDNIMLKRGRPLREEKYFPFGRGLQQATLMFFQVGRSGLLGSKFAEGMI